MVLIDDIDMLSEQCQQIFRTYMDLYGNNVHFLASSYSIQKVLETLQSRFMIVRLNPLTRENMCFLLEKIKEKNNAMSVYKGVQMLNSGRNGANLYGDDPEMEEYISTDPFSKLKYEDLRKVHKDHTVFSVSEKDMAKVKTYDSVDHYQKTREQGYAPLEKVEAENMLRNREKEMQEKIMHKQYQSDLRTLENIEKSKRVQATFLRLGR